MMDDGKLLHARNELTGSSANSNAQCSSSRDNTPLSLCVCLSLGLQPISPSRPFLKLLL
jgi:hypothetical protein